MAERPDRSRAWGVLAVTLALMALVAALSTTTSRPAVEPTAARAAHLPSHHDAAHRPVHATTTAAGTSVHPTSREPRRPHDRGRGSNAKGTRTHQFGATPASSATTRTARAAGSAGTAAGGLAATPASSAGSTGSVLSRLGDVGSPIESAANDPLDASPQGEGSSSDRSTSAPPATGDGTSSAPAPAASTSAASTSASAQAPTASDHGSAPAGSATRNGVVGPGAAASFPAAGGGPISADATWTGAATMELSVSCPDGASAGRTGAPGLSVEVDDTHGNGTCTVTLALPPDESATVAYSLTIEPAT